MSNYNGKLGNSSSVTIRKAGCYITAMANVIATAFTLYGRSVAQKAEYLSVKSGYTVLGIFEGTITETGNGDRNRLSDPKKKKVYSMNNLKEIRIITVDE